MLGIMTELEHSTLGIISLRSDSDDSTDLPASSLLLSCIDLSGPSSSSHNLAVKRAQIDSQTHENDNLVDHLRLIKATDFCCFSLSERAHFPANLYGVDMSPDPNVIVFGLKFIDLTGPRLNRYHTGKQQSITSSMLKKM